MASAPALRVPALIAGTGLLVALLVVHTLDHLLRQSDPVPGATAAAGTAGFVAALVALAMAALGHRWAPAVTALVGLTTAAGFVAIHVLPEWSAVSQPYPDIDVDALSWVGMAVPALAAAAVGAFALRLARERRFAAPS